MCNSTDIFCQGNTATINQEKGAVWAGVGLAEGGHGVAARRIWDAKLKRAGRNARPSRTTY